MPYRMQDGTFYNARVTVENGVITEVVQGNPYEHSTDPCGGDCGFHGVAHKDTKELKWEGTGVIGAPLAMHLALSAAPGNMLVVNNDGAYVPQPPKALDKVVATTSKTVKMTGIGVAGQALIADVRVSAAVDNMLTISSDGLYSPPIPFTIPDLISANSGNALQLGSDNKLYVDQQSGGAGVSNIASQTLDVDNQQTVSTVNLKAQTVTAINQVPGLANQISGLYNLTATLASDVNLAAGNTKVNGKAIADLQNEVACAQSSIQTLDALKVDRTGDGITGDLRFISANVVLDENSKLQATDGNTRYDLAAIHERIFVNPDGSQTKLKDYDVGDLRLHTHLKTDVDSVYGDRISYETPNGTEVLLKAKDYYNKNHLYINTNFTHILPSNGSELLPFTTLQAAMDDLAFNRLTTNIALEIAPESDLSAETLDFVMFSNIAVLSIDFIDVPFAKVGAINIKDSKKVGIRGFQANGTVSVTNSSDVSFSKCVFEAQTQVSQTIIGGARISFDDCRLSNELVIAGTEAVEVFITNCWSDAAGIATVTVNNPKAVVIISGCYDIAYHFISFASIKVNDVTLRAAPAAQYALVVDDTATGIVDLRGLNPRNSYSLTPENVYIGTDCSVTLSIAEFSPNSVIKSTKIVESGLAANQVIDGKVRSSFTPIAYASDEPTQTNAISRQLNGISDALAVRVIDPANRFMKMEGVVDSDGKLTSGGIMADVSLSLDKYDLNLHDLKGGIASKVDLSGIAAALLNKGTVNITWPNWDNTVSYIPEELEWDKTLQYSYDDMVRFGSKVYKALNPSVIGKNPADDTTNWQEEGYCRCTKGYRIFGCITANTGEDPEITTGAAYWQPIFQAIPKMFPDVWDETIDYVSLKPYHWVKTTTYVVGDKVLYLDKIYECLVDNDDIPPDTSTTDWKEVGPVMGEWDAVKDYVVDDQCFYGSHIYTCLVDNKGNIPDASTASWKDDGIFQVTYRNRNFECREANKDEKPMDGQQFNSTYWELGEIEEVQVHELSTTFKFEGYNIFPLTGDSVVTSELLDWAEGLTIPPDFDSQFINPIDGVVWAVRNGWEHAGSWIVEYKANGKAFWLWNKTQTFKDTQTIVWSAKQDEANVRVAPSSRIIVTADGLNLQSGMDLVSTALITKLTNSYTNTEIDNAVGARVLQVPGETTTPNKFTDAQRDKLNLLPTATQLSLQLGTKQDSNFKTTLVTAVSTDAEYPSAKAVWNQFLLKSESASTAVKLKDQVMVTVADEGSSMQSFDGSTNLTLGVSVTTAVPIQADAQTTAGTRSLKDQIQVVINNIASLFANKQDKILSVGSANVLTAPAIVGGNPGTKAISDFVLRGERVSI